VTSSGAGTAANSAARLTLVARETADFGTVRVNTTNGCLGTIAAGGECAVRFDFFPNVEGERTAVMTVSAGALSASLTVIGIGS
jgi:hypothetical protein